MYNPCFAGLVKAKKYDWKDSNLALFGSDTEKEVKSESLQFSCGVSSHPLLLSGCTVVLFVTCVLVKCELTSNYSQVSDSFVP